MNGHIRAARVEHSPRLIRLLDYLLDRGPKGATTRQIIENAHVLAASTAVSELRFRGYLIRCDFVRETKTGGRIYRYTIGEEEPF